MLWPLGRKIYSGFLCVLVFFCPTLLWAVPSSLDPVVIQEGGGSWTIVQHGDEFLHWTAESTTGVPIGYNSSAQQWQVYQLSSNLVLSATGNTLSSGFNFAPFSVPVFPVQDLRSLKSTKFSNIQRDKLATKTMGSFRQLVILAYFSDHASGNTVETTQIVGDATGAPYQQLMNGASGSLASTMTQLSRGKLTITSDVTPWLPLPSPEASYGSDSAQVTDLGSEQLILDALNALTLSANSGIPQDGSRVYDWVTVIHSGLDQARFSSNTLAAQQCWSRSGKLSPSANVFGGNIQVSQYVSVAALGGANLNTAGELGVLCHETGHLLGLPDLYEYQEAGLAVGSWDLMGTGAWGFSGLANASNAPTPFGAWSKLHLGWETATLLDGSGNAFSLGPVHSTGEIYKWTTDRTQEYFLMEYRDGATESWAGMNAAWGGALIWHIDETGWTLTNSGNQIHPLAKIEEADGNDSLGLKQSVAESTDLWNSSSNLSAWTDTAKASGSSLIYGTSYYNRTNSGSSTWFKAFNFNISNSKLIFQWSGPLSTLSILDFNAGKLGWTPIDGATGYDLQRKSGLKGAWGSVTSLGNVLFYIDSGITGIVDYYYRVRANRYSDDLHWSAEMPFSLQVTSAFFDPQEGSLLLNWNLPIKLSGGGALDLSGLNILRSDGNIFFPLVSGSSSLFSYPALLSTDSVSSTYNSSATLQSMVKIWLSDAERYEWIVRSNTSNDNLLLSLGASVATSELSSGNIQNPAQNYTLGNAVHVQSQRDSVAPSILKTSYLSDKRELQVAFNEPLWLTSLTYANFRVSGVNGWSTDLSGSNVTVHGNLLRLHLSENRHLRVSAIENQNNGQLIFNLPSGQVTDFSQVSALTANDANVFEVNDTILPFVQSFVVNNHDESRYLTLTFSEPIFFTTTPNSGQYGFKLCDLNGTAFAAGGNSIGAIMGNAILTQDAPDEFPVGSGNFFRATTAVKMELAEEEVNAIDNFYGLFANPAPKVYGRLSLDGVYSDIGHFLVNNLSLDKNTITSSTNYTQRRRARLIHPHYDPNVTKTVATQESLIWKWVHRVTFEINGGWTGTEKLRIEWDNPNLLSGNGLIAQNIALSGSGNSLSNSTSSANLGILDNHQSVLWDTTHERDAHGYQLSIKRQDGLTLYDRSPSLVEIDNTSPQVTISYISNSTPSYKANAETLVDTSLYNLPLTPSEKQNTNVIILATYTELVIDAPVLTLNQRGSVDPVVTMRSSSGNGVFLGSGHTDSVFFYAYDAHTQDVGNYTDGIANVSINSVPDRAVGHLLAGNTLISTDTRIEGNRTLTPFSRLTFSIDTLPPTIASLDFYVEDISIVGVNSVLRMYYSENMYRIAGDQDATPLYNAFSPLSGTPLTGVLNPKNYTLSQTSGAPLEVTKVEGSGAGPYYLQLLGIVESGVLTLHLNKSALVDFHGNYMAEPSSADVNWPGPLHNRNEVLVAPGGRTRLLLSGGFPPYKVTIDPYFSKVAKIDPTDGHSILGISPGYYTAETLGTRLQLRYVNAQVFDPVTNPDLVKSEISGSFQAFRDELDFKMVAFPFNLANWDGASLIEILKNGAGTNGVDYSLYTFNANLQYEAIGPQSKAVGPGYGFWMAFRKNKQLHLNAEGPMPMQVVGIDLHAGWNLVGNPFDEVVKKTDIYISTGGFRYSVQDLAQAETEHDLWHIDIFSPAYRSVLQLEPFQGAWLYVNNPKGTELIFFRGKESRDYPIDYIPLPKTKPREERSNAPSLAPPPPPGSFSGESSTGGTGASSAGGGGGCLLR